MTTADNGTEMPGYRFVFDWFCWHIPMWSERLAPWAGRRNQRFLEIGCWEGRSTVWLLDHVLTHESGVLDCVDPWSCPIGATIEERFDHNIGLARQRGGASVVKHKKTSAEVLPQMRPESKHLIHVDGSHSAGDVLSDLIFSWRLLRVGGLMICDDYELETGIAFDNGTVSYPQVPPLERPKMAIDAFLQCFQGQYDIQHRGWQVWLVKTQ